MEFIAQFSLIYFDLCFVPFFRTERTCRTSWPTNVFNVQWVRTVLETISNPFRALLDFTVRLVPVSIGSLVHRERSMRKWDYTMHHVSGFFHSAQFLNLIWIRQFFRLILKTFQVKSVKTLKHLTFDNKYLLFFSWIILKDLLSADEIDVRI